MRTSTLPRAAAAVASGLTTLALIAGPMPDELWRAGAPVDVGESGADGAPPVTDPGPAAAPALARCDWTRQPLPDSEIQLPDPDDYLIPMEDGAFLLPDDEVEVNGHLISLPLLEDLMWIAADRGISVEEAIFRYGWQQQFGQITEQLRAAHPDEVADARIVDDGCAARIAFRSAVPELAGRLVQSLPVPVELIGDRGYHEEELVSVLHEVYPRIYEHPKVANAAGGPDSATGVVTIYAQPAGETRRADRVALCRELQPPAPANPAITIRLVLVDDINTHRRMFAC